MPGLGLSSLSGWEIGDSSQIPWAGGSVGSWDFILRELEVLEGFGHTGDIDYISVFKSSLWPLWGEGVIGQNGGSREAGQEVAVVQWQCWAYFPSL